MISDCFVGLYESEIDVIVDECEQHPTIETGGSLFGLWTQGGAPIICLATRPGPGAIRTPTHFQQDAEVHNVLQNLLWDNFRLQWIGLWHSHHRLGLHELSSGDLGRTMSVAARHGKERFTDILCYFVNGGEDSRNSLTNLKPYIYSAASRGRTISSRIEVIATISPFRQQLPRQNRSIQAALRPGRRGKYVLQESQPIWPSHLLPEDAPSRTIERSQSRVPFSESHEACSAFASEPMIDGGDHSPNFAAKVASALEPVMPSLPSDIQQSLEIEEIGNGLVQVNILGPAGECLRLEIDASKEIVVNRAELITVSWGRRRVRSLELLGSVKYQLANYIKEIITQLKY